MKFLADERLYSDTEECLQFLREMESTSGGAAPKRPERYHMYWYGDFSSKQAFAIKSFLATQDLESSELWLWLDAENGYADYEKNPILRPLIPFLHVRCFKPEIEALDTPLEHRPDLYRRVRPSSRADFFRLVVLYKHGGTFADMDIMFLRDISALFNNGYYPEEFCYRWSADQNYGNNAFLRLGQYSENSRALLARCNEINTCYPRDVFQFDQNTDLDLMALPCSFFDPLWPHHDRKDNYSAAPFHRFGDFFRRFGWTFKQKPNINSYVDFFPGALAYHWHNFWDVREHEDSYFGFFNREFDRLIREKLDIEIPPIHDADHVRESVMNDRPARQYK